MKEIINSHEPRPAAKANWFGRLIRTAKAVRFHGSLRTMATALRFHDGWSGLVKAVFFRKAQGLSRGAAQGCSPGRKFGVTSETKAQPQRGVRGLSPSQFSPAARTDVEAQGFSPAKRPRTLPWALALVGLSLFALSACSSEPRTVSAAPEVVRNVQLLTAQQATVPDWLEAVGTLQAAQSSQLSSQITANIVAMWVKEGDRVHRGEVLAVLEDAQPQAAVQQAAAAVSAAQQEIVAADSDYSLAEATFKRDRDLYSKKSVSPQEFDEIKAREQAAMARRQLAQAGLAQAQAALAQAQTTLSYTRVRAPFDGIVTEKRADPGTLATPGMPLLVVEDQRRFRLEAGVDEGDIHLVKLEQAVPVTLDSLPEAKFSGRVAQIVPAADPASRSFVVKIELPPDARLCSGLFGRAHVASGQRQAILLPRTAVLDRGQLQGIYVVGADQVATLRYIALGKAEGQQVEVLSGLQDGERVVAAPGDRELGGKRVE
jgi:RND family efflux transporter MFP subunit